MISTARRVRAFPRARVALLSTGDELVVDGSPLRIGQIRESNLTMLDSMIAATGCEVINLGVVRDDEAELERVFRDVVERCDAIVTSGGVSMGDFDVVKAVLSKIATMHWMQMAIKHCFRYQWRDSNCRPLASDSSLLPITPYSHRPLIFYVLFALAKKQAYALPSFVSHH